jgi:NADH-ubiquinone oxidoreductase chain 6
LRLDFIPITFLVVYVGAIAVLFLFVIMMLNIKLSELKHEKVNFMPLILMFCLIFGLELFFFLICSFNPLTLNAA